MMKNRSVWAVATAVFAALLISGVAVLERDRSSVETQLINTPGGAVHLYSLPSTPSDAPLVVIAHGFAGSVQMMQTIARDLARAGYRSASFDYIGHGRQGGLLSPQVAEIDGTTAQLVAQSEAVISGLRDGPYAAAPLVLLGHSMATDIQIRAARSFDGIAAIVAISMYSDEITAQFPQRLLVLSGEWEQRLRDVGVDALKMIDQSASENETVRQGEVVRRAVFVPGTEHVAVLYAETTLSEIRAWVADATGIVSAGAAQSHGVAILTTLTCLLASFACLIAALKSPVASTGKMPVRPALVVLLASLTAGAGASYLGGSLFGVAGFGALAFFLGAWGAVGLAMMAQYGRRLPRLQGPGALLSILGGFGFAVALDRYGAAFMLSDSRWWVFAGLLPGCVLFMLADRLLMQNAALWFRLLVRLMPVVVLSGLMFQRPSPLGLLFTVLPVLVLFFLVYGTMARMIGRRWGATDAGIGGGICLAWALAASTPLFAG